MRGTPQQIWTLCSLALLTACTQSGLRPELGTAYNRAAQQIGDERTPVVGQYRIGRSTLWSHMGPDPAAEEQHGDKGLGARSPGTLLLPCLACAGPRPSPDVQEEQTLQRPRLTVVLTI